MKIFVFKKSDLARILEFKYIKNKSLKELVGQKSTASVLETLWKSSESVQTVEFIKLFTAVQDNMPWNEVLDGPVQEVI